VGVTTVLAAATWTVRPGGSVSLTSGLLDVRDPATGTVLSCSPSHISGTLKHGGGLSGTGIGTVTSGVSTKCNGPLGLPFTLTATDLPWKVNLTSYDATTGVAAGNLSGCVGLFTAGDPVTMSGKLAVRPKQTITRPNGFTKRMRIRHGSSLFSTRARRARLSGLAGRSSRHGRGSWLG
jgi:hypothetical protein